MIETPYIQERSTFKNLSLNVLLLRTIYSCYGRIFFLSIFLSDHQESSSGNGRGGYSDGPSGGGGGATKDGWTEQEWAEWNAWQEGNKKWGNQGGAQQGTSGGGGGQEASGGWTRPGGGGGPQRLGGDGG